MQPTSPQSTALDPDAVNLAKAIRQTESGGNPTAVGKSGEYGAYQYTPATWAKDSASAGVNVPLQQATLEQQNQVAYTKIKSLKDSGMNVGQIASVWNRGDPNAYLDSNKKGVNSYGASYDVPAYAKSVATAYQTIKNGGQVNADPNNPSSTANQTQVQDPNAPNTYGAMFPASQSDTPVTAGLKAAGNLPSSFYNLGSGLLNAISHPIKTLAGLGGAIVGAGENVLGQNQGNPDDAQQKANAIGKAFMDRYGSLENAQRTATNDPAGFGADVVSLISGGEGLLKGGAGLADTALGTDQAGLASSNAANFAKTGLNVMPKSGLLQGAVDTGVNAVNSAVENVAQPIASGVKGILSAPAKAIGGALGQSTGAGYNALSTGLNAASTGGDAMDAFTQGLRGNSSPDELVSSAKSALQQVVNTRGTNYQQMLSTLKADPSTYDISPVLNQFDTQLQKFGITKADDGTLNFDRSTITDTADENNINKLYNDLKSWGTQAGDRTAGGIDLLKRRISNYYSPSSDFRAMTTSLGKATRGVLQNAPGYTKAMSDYGDMTDQIDEIRKGLSLGDNAMVDTSFRKLMSAVQTNNPIRQQLVEELDKATGGQLLPKIAGTKLNGLMPTGLSKYADIGSAFALGSSGVGVMPLLGLAMTTSPRIVGEFVRTLGLGKQGINTVMNTLNKFSVPTTVGAGLLNNTKTQ